jgi:hypothetical protein
MVPADMKTHVLCAVPAAFGLLFGLACSSTSTPSTSPIAQPAADAAPTPGEDAAASSSSGTPEPTGETTTVKGFSGKLFGATVESFGRLDSNGKVVAAGITVPVKAFEDAPADAPFQDDLVLELPKEVQEQTFVNHLRVNWLANGHGPKPYGAAHFDLHFHRGSKADVEDQIDCRDKRAFPAEVLPEGYKKPELCVSAMGFHSWPLADLSASTWPGSIILGHYAQKLVFIEPMVAKATFVARKDFEYTVAKPETAGDVETLYPTTFKAKYEKTGDKYVFELGTFESIDQGK